MTTVGLASPKQAAEHLSLKPDTVYKMIRAKRIPAVKIGRSVRVPWRWLHAQAEAAGK